MDFTEINPKIQYIDKVYVYTKNGRPISKKNVKRISKLKVPVVYTTLWLAKDPESDIQVIALDSKGKKQYFYSQEWKDKRHSQKFQRMYKFLHKLPILNESIERDMKKSKFTKKKVISFMIKIMQRTNIRVGNKKYLDQNESSGLTTLKKEHVTLNKGRIVLSFRGKHGVDQELVIKSVKISNFLKKMLDFPTDWIMKYQSSDGNWYRVSAQDVNNYIHHAIGSEFTCKDFRTHGANITFLEFLQTFPVPNSERENKNNISKSLDFTAKSLGHNKATSKNSYVMDYIVDEYQQNPEWVKNVNLLKILKKACK